MYATAFDQARAGSHSFDQVRAGCRGAGLGLQGKMRGLVGARLGQGFLRSRGMCVCREGLGAKGFVAPKQCLGLRCAGAAWGVEVVGG